MNKLHTINAEELQNRTYEPTHFLVDELIPEGLHILAGAPKIGKSWLALWLCLCVSQGQPLWNFAVTQGEVLYLSLEDSFQRIQTRLFDLTEDAPPTLHFAIMADTLKHGLEQQIEQDRLQTISPDSQRELQKTQYCPGAIQLNCLPMSYQNHQLRWDNISICQWCKSDQENESSTWMPIPIMPLLQSFSLSNSACHTNP